MAAKLTKNLQSLPPVAIFAQKKNNLSTMDEIILPRRTDGSEPLHLPASRPITLVGANGSGKTRLMHDLIDRYSDRALLFSAAGAFYPERSVSALPCSIDACYREAVASRPMLRADAVSELDKLIFMLMDDEFRCLLRDKAEHNLAGQNCKHRLTKLDRLINLWQQIFPGNQVLRQTGGLMFSTECGANLISPPRLSSGEKAVLYYIAGVLYARRDAFIFIDSPTLFLHPSILNTLWNAIENLRPDCTFIYCTNDAEFVSSRTGNVCVWVRRFEVKTPAWEYEVLESAQADDRVFIDLIGTRKPVLFIEGDATHSLDSKLYPLVFPDYTVRPLGSCDKVIESTRSFNDLRPLHHLESMGIVDRDRRTKVEVDYLRRKNILVPEVAEIENIFLLEGVIRTMARRRGKDPDRVFAKTSASIIRQFAAQYRAQALMHVRHKVKRDVECKVDGKFRDIAELEEHLRELPRILAPAEMYAEREAEFAGMLENHDYMGILRVFNHKPMLGDCGVAGMLGFRSKDAYIAEVLSVLKGNDRDAGVLREAIKYCFRLDLTNKPAPRRVSTPEPVAKPREETPSHARRRNRNRHKRRSSR